MVLYEYEAGRQQFVGKNFSRLMIHTDLPLESPETFAFVEQLLADTKVSAGGEFFVLGESAMAREMSRDFPGELDLITILTTIAFFIVAAIAFKSLSVSLLLVLVIQSSVFITLVLGLLFADINAAVSEILLLVARGCAIGVILTVFILPSLTAVFDRFVCGKHHGADN